MTKSDYKKIYKKIRDLQSAEFLGRNPGWERDRRTNYYISPSNGIWHDVTDKIMLGWRGGRVWRFTQVNDPDFLLNKWDFPQRGTFLVRTHKHLTAVINGTIHDTHHPSRGGERRIVGVFWKQSEWKEGDFGPILPLLHNGYNNTVNCDGENC